MERRYYIQNSTVTTELVTYMTRSHLTNIRSLISTDINIHTKPYIYLAKTNSLCLITRHLKWWLWGVFRRWWPLPFLNDVLNLLPLSIKFSLFILFLVVLSCSSSISHFDTVLEGSLHNKTGISVYLDTKMFCRFCLFRHIITLTIINFGSYFW